MAENQLTATEQNAMRELVDHVAQALAEGQSQEQIVGKMVENGWEQDHASAFVGAVQQELETAEPPAESSSGGGWLVWIGLLLFINLLSYLFDWPFWVY